MACTPRRMHQSTQAMALEMLPVPCASMKRQATSLAICAQNTPKAQRLGERENRWCRQ